MPKASLIPAQQARVDAGLCACGCQQELPKDYWGRPRVSYFARKCGKKAHREREKAGAVVPRKVRRLAAKRKELAGLERALAGAEYSLRAAQSSVSSLTRQVNALKSEINGQLSLVETAKKPKKKKAPEPSKDLAAALDHLTQQWSGKRVRLTQAALDAYRHAYDDESRPNPSGTVQSISRDGLCILDNGSTWAPESLEVVDDLSTHMAALQDLEPPKDAKAGYKKGWRSEMAGEPWNVDGCPYKAAVWRQHWRAGIADAVARRVELGTATTEEAADLLVSLDGVMREQHHGA